MVEIRAKFYRAIGPGSVFPESHRREVVFCGRSNVGKSSLLNALTGVRGLARTSKTPGRTREIHFYEDGPDRFLVDLPGYGYARVSLADRDAWSGLVESYLARRDRVALAVLLVDARHPAFDTDLTLAEALRARGIPFIVALTKADKLGTSDKARSLRAAQTALREARECILTSSKKGEGVSELARRVDALSARGGRGSGSPPVSRERTQRRTSNL